MQRVRIVWTVWSCITWPTPASRSHMTKSIRCAIVTDDPSMGLSCFATRYFIVWIFVAGRNSRCTHLAELNCSMIACSSIMLMRSPLTCVCFVLAFHDNLSELITIPVKLSEKQQIHSGCAGTQLGELLAMQVLTGRWAGSSMAGKDASPYAPQRYGKRATGWVRVQPGWTLAQALARPDFVVPGQPVFFALAKNTAFRTSFLRDDIPLL